MSDWKYRLDSAFPYQTWNIFPPEAIVLVKNVYDESSIGPAKKYWWGYENDLGNVSESVIIKAKRLDRPKQNATKI